MQAKELKTKIESGKAVVGVIGLGYVGLPLVIEFLRAGFSVGGFDVDPRKIEILKNGGNYIRHIHPDGLRAAGNRFFPTDDFSRLAEADCIIVCVPTPLNKYREPDLSHVLNTARTISKYLRKGQLIILESTTYPGTTDGEMRAILEATGFKAGEDFHLAFSPEREDPNNKHYSTSTIPKIVGGFTPACLEAARSLYEKIVVSTVPVSSTRVAESAKLLENIYRSVNIALINEMKMLFDRMGIDVWEVIDAAKTKPFGFQPFYPGPGLGGHCIPIDPFYLTWKAREFGFPTRFIELAGEINTGMPQYVAQKTIDTLNQQGRSIKGAKVLVLGVAYKKDIDDQRESPALKLIEILEDKGAQVLYNDPYVPVCGGHRHYPGIDMASEELTGELLGEMDIVLLATDHSQYDYEWIEENSRLIIDTRNAFAKNGKASAKIFKA